MPYTRLFVIICSVFLVACSSIHNQSNTTVAPNLLVEQQDLESSDSNGTINPLAPAKESDLWQRIRNQFRLDISQDNSRIQSQLNWYKRHQSYLDRVATRGERYLYFIAEQIEARDIPGEIALLPIVESAFDPFAYSHGRASGVWQFIPTTGHVYGLEQDWWFDGRRDIRLATIGALRYLKGLAREFDGDWMLALASYNTGAGRVRSAIRKNKRLGRPTDYWSLDLPRETRAYVPKLIALAKLLDNPEAYDISFKKIENKPYFVAVDTQGQIDLSQAAQVAEVDLEEIYKLNPQFNQWATSPVGPHEILVPIEQKEIMEQNLAQLPANQRIKWERYTVSGGDSLISIANQFHTTPDALRQVNPIKNDLVRIGDKLLIPTAFKQLSRYTHSADNRLDKKQKYARGPKGSKKIRHIVRPGDSFWSLSQTHKVSSASIARWNGMAPKDPLMPGQELVIWSKGNQIKGQNREIIRKIRYSVRSGDSLHRIANKFNVSVNNIKRWNKIDAQKYLQPGDKLILYVDVTHSG